MPPTPDLCTKLHWERKHRTMQIPAALCRLCARARRVALVAIGVRNDVSWNVNLETCHSKTFYISRLRNMHWWFYLQLCRCTSWTWMSGRGATTLNVLVIYFTYFTNHEGIQPLVETTTYPTQLQRKAWLQHAGCMGQSQCSQAIARGTAGSRMAAWYLEDYRALDEHPHGIP